jgi:hypothetical protein
MEFCRAEELETLINATPSGGVCRLENKEYFLSRRVVIRNKTNLVFDGNGAKIVTLYVNNDDYEKSADAFLLDGCQGVTLKNFTLQTSAPANVTATIEEINLEENSLLLRVAPTFSMRGDEVLMAITSVDEEDSTDIRVHLYALHPDPNVVTLIQNEILLANTYASANYEYLGDNLFNVKFPKNNPSPKTAKLGARVCIRHTVYGPSAITLKNSDDTVLKDITLHSTPGMGVMVLTRCHNLTIDGLRMLRREGDGTLMSCNCDGLHVTGLTGKLVLKNSVFDGLGDDALNIHSTAATATTVDLKNRRIQCNYSKKRPDGKLAESWCRAGDIIRFFDTKTTSVKGQFVVTDFRDGVLTFDELQGEIQNGYTLQNTAYAAACEIDGCTVRNTRARGFLLQTNDVEIKNCTFFGQTCSAIKAAPDLDYWYEVGPVDGLYIHHNRFVKNGFADKVSTIALHTTHHRGNSPTVFGLHKNVRIEQNVFERVTQSSIELHATDDVIIQDNAFPEDGTPAILLSNCRNVTSR